MRVFLASALRRCKAHPLWSTLGAVAVVILLANVSQPVETQVLPLVIGIASAVGTVAAALAARDAAKSTREALDQQIAREREETRPFLIASSVQTEKARFFEYNPKWRATNPNALFVVSIELTNMGRSPIYVKRLYTPSKYPERSWYWQSVDRFEGFLISPGESRTHRITVRAPFTVDQIEQSTFYYYFQCSSTGQDFHRLPIPMTLACHEENSTFPTTLRVELNHSVEENISLGALKNENPWFELETHEEAWDFSWGEVEQLNHDEVDNLMRQKGNTPTA